MFYVCASWWNDAITVKYQVLFSEMCPVFGVCECRGQIWMHLHIVVTRWRCPNKLNSHGRTYTVLCVFILFTNMFGSRARSTSSYIHSFAITASERECKMLGHVAVWFYTRYSGFSSRIKRFYDVLKFKHQIYTPSDTELDNILLRYNDALECAHRHHSSASKIVQFRCCCGTLAQAADTPQFNLLDTIVTKYMNSRFGDVRAQVRCNRRPQEKPTSIRSVCCVLFSIFLWSTGFGTMEILLWSIGMATKQQVTSHSVDVHSAHIKTKHCKLVTCEPRNHSSACTMVYEQASKLLWHLKRRKNYQRNLTSDNSSSINDVCLLSTISRVSRYYLLLAFEP